MRLIIDIDDETFKNVTFYGTCWLCPRDKEKLEKSLKNARLIEERAKGKWIDREVVAIDEMAFDEWQQAQCSECGKWHTTPYQYYFESYNYCPHCGADMRDNKEV